MGDSVFQFVSHADVQVSTHGICGGLKSSNNCAMTTSYHEQRSPTYSAESKGITLNKLIPQKLMVKSVMVNFCVQPINYTVGKHRISRFR